MAEDTTTVESGTSIVIIRSARRLKFMSGNTLVKTYPVAVGKSSTPTPLGNYKVVNKIVNPGKSVLGTRWMGLNVPGGNYGIHGNNNASSIGKFISNGCIRMHNSDVEALFPKIQIGTPVTITDGPAESNPVSQDTVTSEGKRKHVIKPGDTLWKISRQYGVSMDLIVRLNTLSNPDLITPGEVIIIP